MFMEKLLLVYNPKSGDGRIRAQLAKVIEIFSNANYRVEVYATKRENDGMEWIEKVGCEFDRIVVCGGDGMFHEAVNGWFQSRSKAPLAYIPSGTVNDFANTHNIPKNDVEAATMIASDGMIDQIDAGLFNDTYFSYVAAFGFATSTAYDTPQTKKRKLGTLAYVLHALEVVDFTHWENNCVSTRIEYEGGMIEGNFLYGQISSSRYVGGMDAFTKGRYDLKDGLLEGVFIRQPMNLSELNSIIASIAKSDIENNPLIVPVQSPWFEFDGESIAWTLDGEYGGDVMHAKIQVVEQQLKVVLPKEEE